MLNFVFWNVGRNDRTELIANLAHQEKADVVILAESQSPFSKLIEALNTPYQGYLANVTPNGSGRITFFSTFPETSIRPIRDGEAWEIRNIHLPSGEDFLLIAVHFWSKQRMSDDDQADLSQRLRQDIANAEQQVGHDRSIVVGDLNMNPFDRGVAGSEGLHGIMTRRDAGRRTRIVKGEERDMFFNPSWSLISDATPGPAGTYHYATSEILCYYWHVFDQVLVRPSLMEFFDDEEFRIVERIGDRKLMSKTGKPDTSLASDHFPIRFTIRLRDQIHGEPQ